MKQILTNALLEHHLVTSMHVVQTHRVHTHAHATVDIVGMERYVMVSCLVHSAFVVNFFWKTYGDQHIFLKHTNLLENISYVPIHEQGYNAIIVKPQQWPTPSESIAIYCIRKLVSCFTDLLSCAKVKIEDV